MTGGTPIDGTPPNHENITIPAAPPSPQKVAPWTHRWCPSKTCRDSTGDQGMPGGRTWVGVFGSLCRRVSESLADFFLILRGFWDSHIWQNHESRYWDPIAQGSTPVVCAGSVLDIFGSIRRFSSWINELVYILGMEPLTLFAHCSYLLVHGCQ